VEDDAPRRDRRVPLVVHGSKLARLAVSDIVASLQLVLVTRLLQVAIGCAQGNRADLPKSLRKLDPNGGVIGCSLHRAADGASPGPAPPHSHNPPHSATPAGNTLYRIAGKSTSNRPSSLKDLQARLGLAYLFITHNLAVVEYLAHRIAVMYLGRIVEEGTVEEVWETPKHPYTQALLSAIPEIDPAASAK
jgi:hypothetical protein